MVFLCLEAMISLIFLPLSNNRDFLFYPATQANLMLFTHFVNYQTPKVLVKNTFGQILPIFRRHKLGHLIDIAYKNYFLANIYSAFDAATFPPLSQYLSNYNISPLLLPTDSFLETVFSNGVRV